MAVSSIMSGDARVILNPNKAIPKFLNYLILG